LENTDSTERSKDSVLNISSNYPTPLTERTHPEIPIMLSTNQVSMAKYQFTMTINRLAVRPLFGSPVRESPWFSSTYFPAPPHTTLTTRVAAKSIAAIPAESIPFIGVAVLIADTGYELYTACETARDLDQLYSDFGMDDETSDDVMHSVCDPELPDAGEIWGGVVENMDQWWESLVRAV
jgi:hypothetical protein